MSTDNEVLDTFGELLMRRVRDWSIQELDRDVTGKTKTAYSQHIAEVVASLTETQRQEIHALIPYIVDTVLHYLLWMIEQERVIQLRVQTHDGATVNITDAELGDLQGYLVDWIGQFSKERYTPA